MAGEAFLNQAVVLLAAAVIGVWLAKRLGLGAVVGYLAAGVAVGPWGLGYFHDSKDILHFAELGVVLLLFVIGLELRPRRLWSMRRMVFGLGLTQVALSGAVLGWVAHMAGLPPASAAVVGITLGLSSTAFALQVLGERNELATQHGRAAFSVLLLQDAAVIPMLAVIPLLPGSGGGAAMDSGVFVEALKVAGVLLAVVVLGRVVLQFGFRMAAETRTREIFAAAALLTVVGTALLMDAVGLSMGLGAFLAGVLLADSHYRHAVEADIEPFKGLLMGLFFLAVGMSVNVGLLAGQPGVILGGVAALVAIKAAILFPLARLNGLSNRDSLTTAVAVSQGGEFAFVLLGVATGHNVVAAATAEVLTLIVIGSMMTTPLLLMALDRSRRQRSDDHLLEPLDAEAPQVVVAGLGRFGHIVGRLLRANGITFTGLDRDPQRVERMKRLGTPAFYGDASRLDVLHSAGADGAAALVVALDDVEQAERIVAAAKQHFPRLKVYARAHNREHAQRLIAARADAVVRETFLASLDLGERLLAGLGLPEARSREAVAEFRAHDEAQLLDSVGKDVRAREPAERDAEGLAARDPSNAG